MLPPPKSVNLAEWEWFTKVKIGSVHLGNKKRKLLPLDYDRNALKP